MNRKCRNFPALAAASAIAGAALAGCPTHPGEGANEDRAARAAADERESEERGDPEAVGEADEGAADTGRDGTDPAEETESPQPPERSAEGEPPTEDDAPAPGQLEPEMHRQDAGEAGADGWYEAASTNGGYRVEMPATFDDYEIAPGDGEVLHVLQASHNGIRYLAQCAEGGEPPQEQLETMRRDLPQLGDVHEESEIRHEGYEGHDLRLTGGVDTTVDVRTLALDDMLCQMVVEAHGEEFPAGDAERFKDSFEERG